MYKSENKSEGSSFFSYGGNYIYYMEKIFDAASLNLLWLLCCLPVVTIGASMAAFYATFHKQTVKREGNITKIFFKSFASNFKPSLGLWAILAAVIFVFQLNLGIVYAKMEGNAAVFMLLLYGVCLFFAIGTVIYAFPALSRFDMPAGWILKVSIYMCFRHLPRTILLVAVTAVGFLAVRQCFPLILILPASLNGLYHYLIEPVLKEHLPKS